jgi:hypothetical protein
LLYKKYNHYKNDNEKRTENEKENREKTYRKKEKKRGAGRRVLLFDTFAASTKVHDPYTLTVCTV